MLSVRCAATRSVGGRRGDQPGDAVVAAMAISSIRYRKDLPQPLEEKAPPVKVFIKHT